MCLPISYPTSPSRADTARAGARCGRSAGFTLVEMLVAVLIFGILAAMTYRALTAVLDTRVRVDAENQKWRSISFALSRIEQDLASTIDRPLRDPTGHATPAALYGAPTEFPGGGILVFARTGELDVEGNETPPMRIGYRVRAGVLEQLNWPMIDPGRNSAATITPLLRGVQQLEFAYAGTNGQPSGIWPVSGTAQDTTLPAAVALRITFSSGQQVSRLFALHAPVMGQ